MVVDLDQTVIQASIDTRIGKAMEDSNDPNHDSIKDVQSFDLQEEYVMPATDTEPSRRETSTTTYYVKIRPGLGQFLESMHNFYEMHVYTMATRSYAVAIAAIIDPEKIYFGDRILSRDESGNIYQKSLKRLFPVSTSMVAIIDDRGDVWGWSPNLVKVIPYNYFKIGDINSPPVPIQQVTMYDLQNNTALNNGTPESIDTNVLSSVVELPESSETAENGTAVQTDDRPVVTEPPLVASLDTTASTESLNDPNVTYATIESNGESHLPDMTDSISSITSSNPDPTIAIPVTAGSSDSPDKTAIVAETDSDPNDITDINLTNGTSHIEHISTNNNTNDGNDDANNDNTNTNDTSNNDTPDEQSSTAPDNTLSNIESTSISDSSESNGGTSAITTEPTNGAVISDESTSDSTDENKPPTSALGQTLTDADTELYTLESVLTKVHARYYQDFDQIAERKGGVSNVREQDLPDIGVILPKMKNKVFDDCVILFSGYIDYAAQFDKADIVQWARSFGAVVVAEMIDSVTHVVSKSNSTIKARKAFRNPKIKVVTIGWVYKCIATWEHVPEDQYLLEPPSGEDPSIMNEGADVQRSLEQEANMDDELDDVNAVDFVKSLTDGNIDWDKIDEELREFMSDNENDEDGEDKENEEDVASDDASDEPNMNGEKLEPVDVEMKDDDEEEDNNDDDDDDDSDSDDDDDAEDEDVSEDDGDDDSGRQGSASGKRLPDSSPSTSAKRLPNGDAQKAFSTSSDTSAAAALESRKRDRSLSSIESDEDEDDTSIASKRPKISAESTDKHGEESEYDEDAFAAELELDLL